MYSSGARGTIFNFNTNCLLVFKTRDSSQCMSVHLNYSKGIYQYLILNKQATGTKSVLWDYICDEECLEESDRGKNIAVHPQN